MKSILSFRRFALGALTAATMALTACTAPGPAARPVAVEKTPSVQIDEATAAYVNNYKAAVSGSLAAGRYVRDLTLRELNAEACLTSRTQRLLGKELTEAEKAALVAAAVPEAQRQAYAKLLTGQQYRVYGMETFSCEYAGLAVPTNVLR